MWSSKPSGIHHQEGREGAAQCLRNLNLNSFSFALKALQMFTCALIVVRSTIFLRTRVCRPIAGMNDLMMHSKGSTSND